MQPPNYHFFTAGFYSGKRTSRVQI